MREAQITRTISRKSKTILFCAAAAATAAASRTYKLFWHTQRYFSQCVNRKTIFFRIVSACRHRIITFKEKHFGHKSTDLNSIEKWFDTCALLKMIAHTHGNILHPFPFAFAFDWYSFCLFSRLLRRSITNYNQHNCLFACFKTKIFYFWLCISQ